MDWPAVAPILASWSLLRSGTLPLAGGWADQPALYVDVLHEVDHIEAQRTAPRRGGV